MGLLDELEKRKLKYPKGLRQFIFHNTDYQTNITRRSRYVNTLEMYKGKLLLRTFAYHNVNKSTKYADIKIQEVCRRLQGEKEVVLCNIENFPMGGRDVAYYGTWGSNEYEFNYVYRASNKNWHFDDYFNMYDQQEIIDKLGIKYCQWFKYLDECKKKRVATLCFFDYICRYLEEPKIEFLVKAGLSQFVGCYKRLNLKEKSLDKVFRINNYWVQFLQELSYTDLNYIKNKQLGIRDIDGLREYKEFINHKGYMFRYHYDNIKKYTNLKMVRYLNKNDYDLITYSDYLYACEKLGYDLENEIYLYPKDLDEKHDMYTSLLKVEKERKLNEGFSKAYVQNLKYVFSKNDLIIVPCENVEQIKNEGAALKHCVATNYSDAYAEGRTNIYFIRDCNNVTQSLATLELQNKRVIQCRAYKNHVPPQEVIKFVNSWCRKNKFKSCFN